jgi:radical SAM protein with 4Fe4S-binding SPASM domain
MQFSLHDTINFLSKLSLPRLYNLAQLLISYQVTKLRGKPVQWGLPMTLSFEPTTACNLRCPECPSGLRSFTRPTGNLKSDFFKKAIDQLSSKLIYLIFYFQGEPYINPDFLKMVAYAKAKRLYTITSTNGHFLTKKNCVETVNSGLDRLIISLDGTTQETYESYRKGGSLDKVLSGIKEMVETKKEMKSHTPHILLQFLVVRPNEHQIPEVLKLADALGVDEVRLKTAQVYDYKNGNDLIPIDEKYSRYTQKEDGTYRVKNTLLNHCWKLWHACVVTWDGLVVPCCFDKDAQHKMGDLKHFDFEQIWKGDIYNGFRKKLLGGRNQIDICTNCTEGCKVWT